VNAEERFGDAIAELTHDAAPEYADVGRKPFAAELQTATRRSSGGFRRRQFEVAT
jgi:hypothetical protein